MTPTTVSLDPAAESERTALENLWQLYAYDFSAIVGLELGDDGRFEGRPLGAYWVDAWRHPFLLRVDGRLAGFALVHTRSHLTGADDVADMAEFFVARRYRRRGVGRRAAVAAFERFRGKWEVRERATNTAATAFWRGVIGEFTGGDYEDTTWADATWAGPVQRFSSAR